MQEEGSDITNRAPFLRKKVGKLLRKRYFCKCK